MGDNMTYNAYGNPSFTTLPYQPSGTAGIAGVTWVSSLQEAQSAIVSFGKQLFMLRDQNIFYVKDSTGALKAFKFEEIPLPSNDPSNYVTKAEFNELRQKYEQLVQQQQFKPTLQLESYATNADAPELQHDAGASSTAILQQGSGDGPDRVTVEQPA